MPQVLRNVRVSVRCVSDGHVGEDVVGEHGEIMRSIMRSVRVVPVANVERVHVRIVRVDRVRHLLVLRVMIMLYMLYMLRVFHVLHVLRRTRTHARGGLEGYKEAYKRACEGVEEKRCDGYYRGLLL